MEFRRAKHKNTNFIKFLELNAKGAKMKNNEPPEFQAKMQNRTNLKNKRAENTMARVQYEKNQKINSHNYKQN
jgi:hypothetical protein